MKNYILILIIISFIFVCNNERIIKLSDFKEENSYLPVKRGQTFTIEIEGNPNRGRIWKVEDPEKLNINALLFPTNLDKNNSAVFYSSKSDQSNYSSGFYHFQFKATNSSTGHEKINFAFYDTNEGITKQKVIKKSINIHVVDPPKRDL
jgi:predicted secreted protein